MPDSFCGTGSLSGGISSWLPSEWQWTGAAEPDCANAWGDRNGWAMAINDALRGTASSTFRMAHRNSGLITASSAGPELWGCWSSGESIALGRGWLQFAPSPLGIFVTADSKRL